jgi:hypothetical protein
MPVVPSAASPVSPLLTAALLLAALPRLDQLGLAHPTAREVIAATGVSRSQAYTLRDRIVDVLPACQRPPGRPPAEPAPPAPPGFARRVLDFVYDHPGAVHGGPERRRYSDGFRLFVLDLLAEHAEIPLSSISDEIRVPEETLRDWLRGERPHVDPPPTLATDRSPTGAQIETVLDAYSRWKGSFTAFCDHVQTHLRIPFGRTILADILELHGARVPARREGRRPDEIGLRDQFETFFPGAQWVGDGTLLNAVIDGHTYTVNVELLVDAHTGAFVGTEISPVEDSAAVLAAFRDGAATTGAHPLAVLLDNKPCNHTTEVDLGLVGSVRIRATLYRAQNKAVCEGAFGLFKSTAPDIHLSTDDPAKLAQQVAALVVATWARAVNHRPRRDRSGRSRLGLYGADPPSPEDIESARAALHERRRRQELARQTRAARQDPAVRALVADAFARLGLVDPEGHLATAIAGYALDHVVAGVATFTGMKTAGTLPDGADARYLLGIVRNVAREDETWHVADELWRLRLAEHDRALGRLDDERERLAEDADPEPLVKAYIDRALATTRGLDRHFWLSAAADVMNAEPEPYLALPLYRLAARRISATHAVPHRQRLAALRYIAARVVPLA